LKWSALNAFHDAYCSGSSCSGQIALMGHARNARLAVDARVRVDDQHVRVVISQKQATGHSTAQYV